MTSFAHTGSSFEKFVAALYMQNIVLYSLVQITQKYCWTAAANWNFENFNDAIRAYRKFIRRNCWSLIDAEFSPLFTGANCTLILLIIAEKSNFEILMTSFAHTGSTLEKVVFKRNVWNFIQYFLAQTAHRCH